MSQRLSASAIIEKDEGYDQFERAVGMAIAGLSGPLFQTNVNEDALWHAYLDGIREDRRQHYNCHCCRRFIQRYGGLARIEEDGNLAPALWSTVVPNFFEESVRYLGSLIEKAKITGIFLSSDKVWGTPMAGGWGHLHGSPSQIFSSRTKSASEVMAEKREEYGILCRSLADYNRDAIAQALRVLAADTLDRSEKTLGVAEWFSKLHADIEANRARKNNIIWQSVATAPPGFCHVRSTMISTLLDDIASGKEYEAIARRWADKMHPLRYQRPTSPPSAGNIEQAEKLVEKLGVANSLKRRFARLDDVLSKFWTPRQEQNAPAKSGGVFGHLKKNGNAQPIELPIVAMTWEKFQRTILPVALSVEINAPHHGSFYGLVTASDPEAPAIIQWDGIDGQPRNPVSWYFYHGGSSASTWGISSGFNKVTAIFSGPYDWQIGGKFHHFGDQVFFAIEGCRDTAATVRRGLALFPEILKSELHGIRAVIEAHSVSADIEDICDGVGGYANGLAFQNGSSVTLRVRSADGLAGYMIDRFD